MYIILCRAVGNSDGVPKLIDTAHRQTTTHNIDYLHLHLFINPLYWILVSSSSIGTCGVRGHQYEK